MDTPSAPAPLDASHQLELAAAEGPWGGPVYRYRGAEIRCLRGGHVCALLMEAHPLHGGTFGVPGTITHLIDLWVEKQRLPNYMRVVPKEVGRAQARGRKR